VQDRDLGARATLALPGVPQVRVIGGVFDGEGKNQVENIDEHFFFTGRIELSPFGRDETLAESAFGKDYVTLGASYGHNTIEAGDKDETIGYYEADLAGSWHGLSGMAEYFEAHHSYAFTHGGDPATLPPAFHGKGWVAQAAYLVPVELPPLKKSRFEVAFRAEEIDRNDTVPVSTIGDPNQSVRELTLAVSYYLRGHSLKAQLAASHFQEIEDKDSTGADATYKNDQLLLQITYRLEAL
jgi:hypothetical protein